MGEQQKQGAPKGTLLTIVNSITGKQFANSNFTRIPNSIIFETSITPQDKELYNILLALPYRKRNTSKGIMINHDYLCKLMGVKNRQTILRIISRLEVAGYCRRVKISGTFSELQVIIKPSETEKQQKNIDDFGGDF